MADINEKTSVLSAKYGDGPLGLGDPEDQSLRKVEVEVLIPKMMREKAQREKCPEEVQKFTECCKSSSILMVVSCRNENDALKQCLTKWYNDEDFKKQCTEEYLKDRTEFRMTGATKKNNKQRLPVSM